MPCGSAYLPFAFALYPIFGLSYETFSDACYASLNLYPLPISFVFYLFSYLIFTGRSLK